VGALTSAHIFGTLVPVEEPSTASKADICTAANRLFDYLIAAREPWLRWSRGEASSPSPHFCRATSAALMPSSARPKVTPSSMTRRSFRVSAMRVYFVVSDGSLASPSAISRARGSSLSAATI
jgi:hypothetical protein